MLISTITILKIFHLVGLIAGLGGAIYCDILMFRKGILKPLNRPTLQQIEYMSRIVMLGLLILWVSGVGLVYEILQTKPEFWSNDKFWAKVTMVAALTVNGLFIHVVALRFAEKRLGKRIFEGTHLLKIATLCFFGAVSLASWLIPFVLGTAPELSYVIPYEEFFLPYALMICVFWVGMLLVSRFAEAFAKRKAADIADESEIEEGDYALEVSSA